MGKQTSYIHNLARTIERQGNLDEAVAMFEELIAKSAAALRPGNSVLAGGRELRVEWESRGMEPLDRGMTVEFTADGEQWQEIAAECDNPILQRLATARMAEAMSELELQEVVD